MMHAENILDAYSLILLAGEKGLIEFNGQPLLIEQLQRFSDAGGKRAVIVLGPRPVDYFAAMPWLEDAEEKWMTNYGLEVASVIDENHEQGQFSSIQAGAEFLLNQISVCDGAFVLPVEVLGTLYQELAATVDEDTQASLPLWDEQGGFPILLSSSFLATLSALPISATDSRLDLQIQKLPKSQVAHLTTSDPSVIMTITPDIYPHFRA